MRATLAGAHLAPVADAQRRALRVAAGSSNRTVYVGQATRPTLKALARKGFGTLNYEPGMGRRKVIERLTVNSRGLENTLHFLRPFLDRSIDLVGCGHLAVSKAVGHASIAVTSDIYGSLFEKAHAEMSHRAAALILRQGATKVAP